MQGGCYTPNQLFHLGGCVVVVEKKRIVYYDCVVIS